MSQSLAFVILIDAFHSPVKDVLGDQYFFANPYAISNTLSTQHQG